jgi:hypothetical protein
MGAWTDFAEYIGHRHPFPNLEVLNLELTKSPYPRHRLLNVEPILKALAITPTRLLFRGCPYSDVTSLLIAPKTTAFTSRWPLQILIEMSKIETVSTSLNPRTSPILCMVGAFALLPACYSS